MWNNKTVSVVLTSYREKDSIRSVIESFFSVPYVDEVVVVDNNAESGSIEEVRKTKARLVFEKRQGHGWALQRGLREASGDYIFTAEGDGTFQGTDAIKFLSYINDVPVVFGTRTENSTMERGALGIGMWGKFRKWADVGEAKIIEFLFSSNRLTDVGCTFSLIRKDVVSALDNRWLKGGSYFVTEMRLQVAAAQIPFVEIPVVFQRRLLGKSYVVDTRIKLAKEGIKMLFFIFEFWLRAKIFRKKQFGPIKIS